MKTLFQANKFSHKIDPWIKDKVGSLESTYKEDMLR